MCDNKETLELLRQIRDELKDLNGHARWGNKNLPDRVGEAVNLAARRATRQGTVR